MTEFDSESYDISVSRGDSIPLDIYFSDDGADGATVYISLKEKGTGKNPLWQKTYTVDGDYFRCFINCDETDYPCGEYVWDVRIKYSNTDVETPMSLAKFTIKEVAGNV